MLKALILQVIVLIGSSLSYQINGKWYCRNNMDCLPWESKNTETLPKIYETQNLCRLMCGKFRGLWPQVTRICNIEKSVNPVNFELITFDYPNDNENIKDFYEQVTLLFKRNLIEECGKSCSMQSNNSLHIRISVVDKSLMLNSLTDESYRLNISTMTDNEITVQISAKTIFGTRHALETLSQLMVKTVDDNDQNGLLIVSSADILDKPFYQHRGLLIDTARHFISIASLMKILDGMSANKMNVFHWHITDSQSFPMEIKRRPEMHGNGAFSKDKVYFKSDIDKIVQYAKYRGIRVIFELDAPAHAGKGWEWGEKSGLGKLAVCVDDQPWRKSCIQPNCGQLNPSNENLYSVLHDIYQDIRDYKEKNEFIHMGGDEVFVKCWNNTKEITDYMATKNYDRNNVIGFLQLWSEFQGKALNIWDNITDEKESIVMWSSELTLPENIEKFLPKERYIIQTWIPNNSDIPQKLLDKGYRLIMTTKNAWYFDHGFWGNTKYYNWKTVYANTLPRNELVLGGEVCMWSEYLDEHSIEMKIFPRLNAAAERLWANPKTDLNAVESRFYRQRERIVAKGIQADAILTEYCTLFEGECRG
ncbi:hypothetical protein PVAND_005195 [Polypedilum vanderplanki]|uniref:Beta-hexosaminidase n=1 Tax=Polypedilum vanderplanki TaxID=319348 RepID=A0A9J6BZ71_POLVA|nr:hypothetical protein PVAND_005195 [Polypedilum vanderplanki]